VTDAAINLAPNLEQKADIIGVTCPRVAILAAVETINPAIPATLDAAALCKMADRGQIAGAVLDGSLAFDNAVSIAAAKAKGIKSQVAGLADILVMPDLESGNMLAKQLMFMGGRRGLGRKSADSTDQPSRLARITYCLVRLGTAAHPSFSKQPALSL